jgi:hypothetical protein
VYKEPVPVTTSSGFAPYFGTELRRHRERLGWKCDELAERLPWSIWTIRSIEQGRRKPPPGLGEHADALFGLPGVMTSLAAKTREDTSPFGDFVDLEQRAASIALYDMRIVPGLLQTEAYIRALNRTGDRRLTADEIERLVQMRIRRQKILYREHPPTLHAIIDEAVLYRQVGDAATMHGQLAALTSPLPHVTVQVLPLSAGSHESTAGPLTVLHVPNEPDVAFADGWARGQVVDTPEDVFRAQQAFEQLAALALPPDMSAELIEACMEEI